MKSKKKPIIVAAVIIFAVIVLPLAYSLFYLGAFWDPYSRLEDLPIAVVNEDTGAEINGETRNLGDEMVDKLKDNSELKWVFTDADNAAAGVDGTEYYAEIIIPENFSADIASASTTDKATATITYSSNEKRNFLATQIMNRAVLDLELELRSQINEEITSQLASKLETIPSDLQDLSDGLGEIYDGTTTLKNGMSDFSDGQSSLLTGINSLNTGLSTLHDGSTELSSGIATLHSGIITAENGAKTILSEVQASETDLAKADQLNSGAQQVSDGLTELSLGVQTLYEKASSTTSGIPALQAGLSQLDQGANLFSIGLAAYTDGVNSLISKNESLAQQLATIYTSTLMTDSQKVAALGSIVSSISSSDVQTQLSQLSAAGTSLQDSAAQLTAGADTLNAAGTSLTDLENGLSAVNSNLKLISDGANQVSAGTSVLSEKVGEFSALTAGLAQLVDGLNQLNTGSQQAYSGSVSLADGISSAKNGGSKLASGATTLSDAANDLLDGTTTLSDGVQTAKDSVDSSIADANEQVAALDGLADYASDPVDIEQDAVNPVANYGTAFAPYFMSLSLYVGALIMFVGIYLDADEKIKILSRNSDHKMVRVAIFALIGVAQAVLLALLVKYGLGLTIANLPAYYLSSILVSMVFISIVEFFFVNLKDAGKFISMLLLILQLTSCGGTFPMETVPKFFQILYPFMPMTYSVTLFKEAISGYDSANANQAIIVLLLIFACFTALTMLFSIGKKAKEKIIEKREASSMA